MNELQPYQQSQQPAVPGAALDGWIAAFGDIAKLAEYIAETDFVPDAMKGKPAAVSAAILTGREMGLEPMTALRNIHVIKGKPGLSAELMRAQVLAAGHSIEFTETTDSRCVIAGKRRGDAEWTKVSFTKDQAKTAKIDLGSYPEDKLVARATSRLCRRKFADVVAGLTSVDELEDAGTIDADATVAEPAKTQRKTAQRKQTKAAPKQQPPKQIEQPAEPESAGPPLPGEEDDVQESGDAAARHGAGDSGEDSRFNSEAPAPSPSFNGQPVTKAQLTKLGTLFSNAGIKEREQRVDISSQIVNRRLQSSSDMTKQEAASLIDTLEQLAETGDLAQTVNDLVEAQQSQQSMDWPDVAQPGSKSEST